MTPPDIFPASTACPTEIDALLSRSYRQALCDVEPPDLLRAALPVLGYAKPDVLAAPGYFVAVRDNQPVGVAGWSHQTPFGRPGVDGLGHIRQVAVCPAHRRQGIGRALFDRIVADGRRAGVEAFVCLSTRPAVAFYTAMGFATQGDVDLQLGPGLYFPAVQMRWGVSQGGI